MFTSHQEVQERFEKQNYICNQATDGPGKGPGRLPGVRAHTHAVL
jgi:hypothetical protein